MLWGTAALPGQTRLCFFDFEPIQEFLFSVHGRHLQLHENEKDLSGYVESLVGLAK